MNVSLFWLNKKNKNKNKNNFNQKFERTKFTYLNLSYKNFVVSFFELKKIKYEFKL